MIFGIQFYMFKVRYAVKGKEADVLNCRQIQYGQFMTLENKDAAIEALQPNQLKMLYTFFTGKELTPFPRYLRDVYAAIKKVFDEKQFSPAAGFKIPPFADDEEPLEVSHEKMKKRMEKVPELKTPEAYDPKGSFQEKTAPSSKGNSAEEETEENEDTDMAKKSSKKSAKKSPKKAKSTASGAGRKARYSAETKLKGTEKENPLRAEHAGKPAKRHACYEIIRKNPGITYENFIKKGGNAFDLGAMVGKKLVTVSG